MIGSLLFCSFRRALFSLLFIILILQEKSQSLSLGVIIFQILVILETKLLAGVLQIKSVDFRFEMLNCSKTVIGSLSFSILNSSIYI